MPTIESLDKLDRAILRLLQADGRQTYDVVGEQVGLSASAVLRRVKRLEDPRLLTGHGVYVDDIALPGMLHACFVRSPFPRAAIRVAE